MLRVYSQENPLGPFVVPMFHWNGARHLIKDLLSSEKKSSINIKLLRLYYYILE